ncbi:hypothetical protein L202_03406 [Cryptococcus amylolentus CBS 6039]|uniref:Uncharacterized protein n=2 Tax=Cryptococcus amylolentus TaxID=104669 RepID=A0A1E3HTE1_9TREE|nr:hypothetical protein L202_03406 [Cryptococcus amylolentus CBS 6039]ODN79415.1 hypothetical protein L202_03406 [Cryptococcus amylolentus CBS 6039]ODO07788.1 hypothetical protein I350_03367 [Cryptococcus amylolentus CBS 6273]
MKQAQEAKDPQPRLGSSGAVIGFMKCMEGTTPQHFDTFAASNLDHQNLLEGLDNPSTEMEVKHILMAGLSSHLLTLEVEGTLEQKCMTHHIISISDLIVLMSKRVVACAAQLAAFQDHQAASEPPFCPTPATTP